MKKTTILLLMAILSVSCKNKNGIHQEQKGDVVKITEEEALNLLHTWTNAYLAGDVNSLNEVLDNSWAYSGSADGKVSDKTTTIEEFSNADYTFHNISYDDLSTHIYGDIAIVRGKESMVIVGSSGEDTTKLRLRFTDVYQKIDGKIRAISTHSSPIID
ncbi:hypothetical protein HME9304_02858 [Flagellimonas maritima]|uniref:DUF4440 domain-containing protein n=1 Tax=Flagellimonas maritima TaxID=1383885 RepID=A0A2Z4LWT5_9FLAO|nr:nuclear transport factor 2 family protein [Allomuricauda aurantiaca]AWX45828.1 hypothetical protein HME9304_02858 [Allomuricauda aurantiaca]